MSTQVLDRPTRALIGLAAAIADGGEAALNRGVADVQSAGTPARWVDELLLQSLLMVGWPRTLVAAAAWRAAAGHPAEDDPGERQPPADGWVERGEATCRIVYGDHYDKLRANVAQLHPALDAWMIREGYGRTLGRPGLDLRRRELCVIAQTAVLETARQLRSHLRGAVHAGASAAEIHEAIELAAPLLRREWRGRVAELAERAVQHTEPQG